MSRYHVAQAQHRSVLVALTMFSCTVEPVKTGRPRGHIDRPVYRGVRFMQVRSFAEDVIQLRIHVMITKEKPK